MNAAPASPPHPADATRRRRSAQAFDLLFSVLLLVLTLRTFLFFPARVPTESMLPTFQPGARILVDRCTLNLRPPAPGDCVVLRQAALTPPSPQPRHGILVKRLVGRPGDRVRLNDHRELVVNGRVASDLGGPLGRLYRRRENARAGEGTFLGHLNQQQVLALGGAPHVAPRFPDDRTELHVRPGHVVVLGDFSLASLDSRTWGDVPQGAIVGLARSWSTVEGRSNRIAGSFEAGAAPGAGDGMSHATDR